MTTYLDFAAPSGLRVRGTVLVLPGRGESPATYRRFGARIASDAYTVRVLPAVALTTGVDATLDGLDAALTTALAGLEPDRATPLFLIGSDTGAAALAALVARGAINSGWRPDALVLAALPGYGSHDVGRDWDGELDARSHCPMHRGVLTTDDALDRGTIGAEVDPALLDLAYGSTVDLPHLLLVGDADPVADRHALARAAKALPTARLSVVRGAHHDVLNDLQHRSVAAEIVSFLESVRTSPPLRPTVYAESSAW